jgi:putative addiction module component (TIGR02574 family)
MDEVNEAASTLSDLGRFELAARLLENLEPDTWSAEDWDEEIRRRLDAIRAGKATMIPWEQARVVLWIEVYGTSDR